MRIDLNKFRTPVYSKFGGYEEDIIKGAIREGKERIYTTDPMISEKEIETYVNKSENAKRIKMQSFMIPMIIDNMSKECEKFL